MAGDVQIKNFMENEAKPAIRQAIPDLVSRVEDLEAHNLGHIEVEANLRTAFSMLEKEVAELKGLVLSANEKAGEINSKPLRSSSPARKKD